MQIVIDIPKKFYEDFKLQLPILNTKVPSEIAKYAIATGTPLPDKHGRIGDLDQVLIWMIYKKGIIDKLKCGEITSVFKDATIIEADKESEE